MTPSATHPRTDATPPDASLTARTCTDSAESPRHLCPAPGLAAPGDHEPGDDERGRHGQCRPALRVGQGQAR